MGRTKRKKAKRGKAADGAAEVDDFFARFTQICALSGITLEYTELEAALKQEIPRHQSGPGRSLRTLFEQLTRNAASRRASPYTPRSDHAAVFIGVVLRLRARGATYADFEPLPAGEDPLDGGRSAEAQGWIEGAPIVDLRTLLEKFVDFCRLEKELPSLPWVSERLRQASPVVPPMLVEQPDSEPEPAKIPASFALARLDDAVSTRAIVRSAISAQPRATGRDPELPRIRLIAPRVRSVQDEAQHKLHRRLMLAGMAAWMGSLAVGDAAVGGARNRVAARGYAGTRKDCYEQGTAEEASRALAEQAWFELDQAGAKLKALVEPWRRAWGSFDELEVAMARDWTDETSYPFGWMRFGPRAGECAFHPIFVELSRAHVNVLTENHPALAKYGFDEERKEVIVRLSQVANRGGGFEVYRWPMPGASPDHPSSKLGYVIPLDIPGYGPILFGSGIYWGVLT
jgi:hypothetical protein